MKYMSDPLFGYEKDTSMRSYKKVMKMIRSDKYKIRTSGKDKESVIIAALYLVSCRKGNLYISKSFREEFYYKIDLKGVIFVVPFGLDNK